MSFVKETAIGSAKVLGATIGIEAPITHLYEVNQIRDIDPGEDLFVASVAALWQVFAPTSLQVVRRIFGDSFQFRRETNRLTKVAYTFGAFFDVAVALGADVATNVLSIYVARNTGDWRTYFEARAGSNLATNTALSIAYGAFDRSARRVMREN